MLIESSLSSHQLPDSSLLLVYSLPQDTLPVPSTKVWTTGHGLVPGLSVLRTPSLIASLEGGHPAPEPHLAACFLRLLPGSVVPDQGLWKRLLRQSLE